MGFVAVVVLYNADWFICLWWWTVCEAVGTVGALVAVETWVQAGSFTSHKQGPRRGENTTIFFWSDFTLTYRKQQNQSLQLNSGLSYHIRLLLLLDSVPVMPLLSVGDPTAPTQLLELSWVEARQPETSSAPRTASLLGRRARSELFPKSKSCANEAHLRA